jgi:platelet-activating factor acetylhydrolase IB subunit alpha
VSGGNDQIGRTWDATSGEAKTTLIGHDNYIECCVFAPPSSYKHLATLARLKKTPPAGNSAEFIATGSRDKTIKLWDSRGTLIKTLVGHDNWVRGLVFHPEGKYLISVSDDRTLRCWDLSQEGRLAKTLEDSHGHFVSCIRWAPSLVINSPIKGVGTVTNGDSRKEDAIKVRSRCVIVAGSVDLNVRIFASWDIQPKNWLLMTATTTNFLASRLSEYPFEKVSLRKSATKS